MKFIGSWGLESSSTLGRLGLEGLFDIRLLQLIHWWNNFNLEGRGEGSHRVLRFLLR